MSQTNQTALQIAEKDLTEIKEYIQKLQEKLMPYLKNLSPDGRSELPKMGNKTYSIKSGVSTHFILKRFKGKPPL